MGPPSNVPRRAHRRFFRRRMILPELMGAKPRWKQAMFRLDLGLFATVMLMALPATGSADTPLDRYVSAPDPNYRYELLDTIPGDAYTAFVLEMTSQQWRTAAELDRPIWKHWLTIVEPDHVKTSTGLLVISDRRNDIQAPSQLNPLLAALAAATGSGIRELPLGPNQPLRFAGETRKRSE